MTVLPSHDAASRSTVAVAIVCICGAEHLERCLAALMAQQGVPPFQMVVACDPLIPGIDAVAQRHPEARIFSNADEHTPLELTSAALRACDAGVMPLTEGHCVPRSDWVRRMLAARAPGRAVAGGRVEIRGDASTVNWAVYFVDLFRHAAPVTEGPSPNLTVCNVAYDREKLDAVRDLWRVRFEEPAVHGALRERSGTLWLVPESEVAMRRSVSLRAARYEGYAFGRSRNLNESSRSYQAAIALDRPKRGPRVPA